MTDTTELAAAYRALARRLDGPPNIDDLKAVYLELSFLVGQVQGAVHEAARTSGTATRTVAAETSLTQLKSSVRQIGFEIRLASPAALQIGLQTALGHAIQTLQWLDEDAR